MLTGDPPRLAAASSDGTVAAVTGGRGRPAVVALPAWPVLWLFAGLPVWWLTGLLDLILIPAAGVMLALLARADDVRAPRGFGVWLMFVAWSGASVVMLVETADLIGFSYRMALYVSGGVLFLYVYNARAKLRARRVTACLTAWWLMMVVGGYIGLLAPEAVLHTPLSRVLPDWLLDNDLVNHMVVRRTSQFNPESYLQVAPRPSAPFLYTNNWGNVYSLLLPFAVAHLVGLRGRRSFWAMLAVFPISAVPALLTLNRGMFLGIGVAVAYVAVRALLAGHLRLVLSLAAAGAVAVALFTALPVEERQGQRLSSSAETTSTDTRASLYRDALAEVPRSPVFGRGAPLETAGPGQVPVGTQGQVWMLLVSHGPVSAVCFVGWFLLALRSALHRRDAVGVAAGTTLLVSVVELLYYGVLPYGLPLMMVAAALALRGPDQPVRSREPAQEHA